MLENEYSIVYTFEYLPKNVDELKKIADFSSPFDVAALVMAVTSNLENDFDETIKMLNFLRGPEPLNDDDIDLLRATIDPLVIRSCFIDTDVSDDFKIKPPYRIQLQAMWNQTLPDCYMKIKVISPLIGTISDNCIKVRKLPTTKEWFFNEFDIGITRYAPEDELVFNELDASIKIVYKSKFQNIKDNIWIDKTQYKNTEKNFEFVRKIYKSFGNVPNEKG